MPPAGPYKALATTLSSMQNVEFQNRLTPNDGIAGISTQFTGFDQKSHVNRGQSTKDFSRLLSAQSKYNVAHLTCGQELASVSGSLQSSLFNLRRSTNQKWQKSGIIAIDRHYDQLNANFEVEHLRYTQEFKRLYALIERHWKANKFPKCEQTSVQKLVKELLKLANFKEASEKVIDQLEDYLKFIREFTAIENRLKFGCSEVKFND